MPKVLKLHSQLLFSPIYYALKASIVIDELPVAVEGSISVPCVTQCGKLILCKTMLSLHRLERSHCRFFGVIATLDRQHSAESKCFHFAGFNKCCVLYKNHKPCGG